VGRRGGGAGGLLPVVEEAAGQVGDAGAALEQAGEVVGGAHVPHVAVQGSDRGKQQKDAEAGHAPAADAAPVPERDHGGEDGDGGRGEGEPDER
jgi:hypothetical protein